MSLTLLLDLDDTLLVNPLKQFLPAYLSKLSTHLAPYAEPSLMVQALLAGTRQMVENQQPDCNLRDVFGSVFYPSLKVLPQEIQPAIDQFYTDVFPSLKQLTQIKPEAVELVDKAFERGYRVAISTNPLFPQTAIVQRLEWAGLSVQKYPFVLISSFESFHFSKPNPAFFAEMMARMGWPEDPVLVVGNDLENDIRSATQLGLPTYFVLQPGTPLPVGEGSAPQNTRLRPTASGDLAGLLSWLDETPFETLQPRYDEPSAILAVLRSTPAALNTMCDTLAPAILARRPKPAEWSPSEILCHLRDVDNEVNLPRLKKVLQEDNPFIPGADADRWAEERAYHQQDGLAALHRFSTSRQELIHLMEKMSPDDWGRPARHAIFGPTNIKELVTINASHDQIHIRQMVEALRN